MRVWPVLIFLSNCPVILMVLQEKSRNEACLVSVFKLAAVYSIYCCIMNPYETLVLQRNFNNIEKL